jgi:DNA-binding transcriptional regulator GbsR (MarR family)
MSVALTEKTQDPVKTNTAGSRLEPVEVEVIHLFVQFAGALGQPRSVAEIYGLLFVSEKPLAMDTLIERLNLSKGSASQGLKYLQDLGAVRTVYVAGDRRTHYEAVAELRKLAGRFLRQQVLTHFEDSETRLDRIAAQTRKLSDEQQKHIAERIKLLRRWERTGRRILPFVLKMLGGDGD